MASELMSGVAEVGAPRHSALVRLTHWVNAAGTFALMVSGVAILLAHPRLYWGETGAVGTPSLIDLPLPFMLTGSRGGDARCTSSPPGFACSLASST
jgi:hypothetical protein